MTITVNTKAYTEDSTSPNVVRYAGPLQTASITDNIEIKRLAPKRTATYDGNSRTWTRTTRSVVVNGKTLVAYMSTEASIPVGFPDADVTTLQTDHGALISSAIGLDIVKKAKIKY